MTPVARCFFPRTNILQTIAMRPLLVAAGAWPSVPPRHCATAFVEARAEAADGEATTTRWTGGDDGSIVRWETKTGDADHGEPVVPVAFLGGHSGRVTALAVSEADGLLLSGDDDGVVCAWDTRTNACVARRDVSSEPFSCAVDAIGMDDASISTRPTVARARAGNVARALEPRTLRVIEATSESSVESNDSANSRSARVAVAVPFDPDASLAEAWRAAAAAGGERESSRERGGARESRPDSQSRRRDDRATSCCLLRGGGGADGALALAVGLEDGDVRVERLFAPSDGGAAAARGAERRDGEAAKEPVRGSDAKRSRAPRGTVTASATVGGLLVTGSADGSVSFWDVSNARKPLASLARRGPAAVRRREEREEEEREEEDEEEEATASFAPSLVASLAHHARGVRAVAALPMPAEDATGAFRLGVSVDGEGVVGVFSVADAARDVDGTRRVRCEMLLRPREPRWTRKGKDGENGRGARGDDDGSTDDESSDDGRTDDTRKRSDESSDADVRLVWDASRGVLTALSLRNGGPADTAEWFRDVSVVAYDVLGSTLERSLEGADALALFAEARRAPGAAELRVGWSEAGWTSRETGVSFFGLPRTEKNAKAFATTPFFSRVAGRVARARVVDVAALLEFRETDDDDATDAATASIRGVALAMHAWGRDDEADEAARDAFFGSGDDRREGGATESSSSSSPRARATRLARPVLAVVGVGNAVSVAAPSAHAARDATDPRSDAERAVAVAACAARLAFVAAKRHAGPKTTREEPERVASSSSLGSLHAATARLSTSRTLATPEHLAALARLRHSPCVPIQDAARALFRANATAPSDGEPDPGADARISRAESPTRGTLAESARAAVAAAEASVVSASESAHHARSGRALESLRASREAETLAEEAVDLSMPAVVAAATRAARAGTLRTGPREDGDGGERTRGFLFATTDARETHAEVTRALLALLAAPRAAIVADAASLLAEGIESEADRSRAVSFFANGDETDAALAETFALAEALGSVGGWRGGLDAATERMAARHATGALLRALATAYPKAFLAHFASRLESPASAESPAHMSAFLALAEIAREKPRVLERNLDAVAAVVAAASAAATPALRKTCRAGARALATDLAQHSGRVACFASRSRDVERLAVAVEEPEAGETGMAGRAIHVYDLVAGAKTRVLKEEADEDVVGAGEARAAAAAAASVMHAANELTGAFSATLGALASPASAATPPPRNRELSDSAGFARLSTTVPRVRVEHDGVKSPSVSSPRSPPIGSDGRARTTPVRRSVDVIPSPDPSDGNQQYAAAAAAAAMALAANDGKSPARRARRSAKSASPRVSPRVSSNASSPSRAFTATRGGGADDASRHEDAAAFALAFDDDGARLAGYRDAGRASRVRVWHVAPTSFFSRPSALANLASLGARVSGAVAGAAGASGIGGIPSAGFAAVVGCAESFLCGDTAAMDDVFLADESVSPSGDESRQTRPSRRRVESRGVSLEWRGSDAVVLRRGNVEAAFGVRE